MEAGMNTDGRHVGDTYLHSWEVLAEIIKSDEAKDMILDIGM